MLYNFIKVQWYSPCKGDWTEQVKEDLEDFKLARSFDHYSNLTPDRFKELVKHQASFFSLEELNKQKKSHSKLRNLTYKDNKTQSYFREKTINNEEKRNLFKFRTHMARFKSNYKGLYDDMTCPVCKDHDDTQRESFRCKGIFTDEEINANDDYEEIFTSQINNTIVKKITKIVKTRERYEM